MRNPRRIFLIEEFRNGQWQPIRKERWYHEWREARKYLPKFKGKGVSVRIGEYVGLKAVDE